MQSTQSDLIERKKQRLAGMLLAGNVVMTLVKFLIAVVTGSVGLLSEAIHSATDVISSLFAFLGIRAAAAPPDEDHPYGHGKIESLAGFGEAVMVFGIVIYVAFESIHRLFVPARIDQPILGAAVIGSTAVIALLVGLHTGKVASDTGSIALRSNAAHWLIDAVTSAVVLIGLITYHFTGWQMADPILGLCLAVWMGWGAWGLSKAAFHELIDTVLPEEENILIAKIIEAEEGVMSYHRLRTRRSGNLRHIDFHIVVPRELTVVEAHDLADRLENKLETALHPAHAVVHVDPFDPAKVGR
ncbi:MAG: cation diffusion facilitator family transporter [Fimbriimonadaceae bacterium]